LLQTLAAHVAIAAECQLCNLTKKGCFPGHSDKTLPTAGACSPVQHSTGSAKHMKTLTKYGLTDVTIQCNISELGNNGTSQQNISKLTSWPLFQGTGYANTH